MLLATVGARGNEEQKPYWVAIWLIPAQPQHRQIQKVILDLAAQYSSAGHYLPVFTPHATLCVGTIQNEDTAKGLQDLYQQIDRWAEKNEELSLPVKSDRRIDERKQQWSQYLFLALDTPNAPEKLTNEAKVKETFPAISRPDPNHKFGLSTDANDQKHELVMLHVSLIYNGIEKSLPDIRDKVENKNEYDLPDQVVFESIQVVRPKSGDFRDILKEHPDRNADWEILYTKKLKLPVPPLRMIMAGGQTGVDQAAWRAARLNRILIGGWCPPGRHLGHGQWVPEEFPCQETRDDASADHPETVRSQRTEWNVRDSDATLVLLPFEMLPDQVRKRITSEQKCLVSDLWKKLSDDEKKDIDGGTRLTADAAVTFKKPFLICDPRDSHAINSVVAWIKANGRQGDWVQRLNVGGPSEFTKPGIGGTTEQFLLKVFAQLRATRQASAEN